MSLLTACHAARRLPLRPRRARRHARRRARRAAQRCTIMPCGGGKAPLLLLLTVEKFASHCRLDTRERTPPFNIYTEYYILFASQKLLVPPCSKVEGQGCTARATN